MLLVFLKHPSLLRSSLGGRAVKRNCAGAVGLVVTGPWWWGGSPHISTRRQRVVSGHSRISRFAAGTANDIIKCSASNDANYFVRIYYSKFGRMKNNKTYGQKIYDIRKKIFESLQIFLCATRVLYKISDIFIQL